MRSDPVLLRYSDDEKHREKPWWLSQGNETFFPDLHVPNWKQLRWATEAEASAWAVENLGTTPTRHPSVPASAAAPPPPHDPPARASQPSLFRGDDGSSDAAA